MASYSASYLAAFVAAIKNPNALGTRDWRAGRRLKGIRAQKKKDWGAHEGDTRREPSNVAAFYF